MGPMPGARTPEARIGPPVGASRSRARGRMGPNPPGTAGAKVLGMGWTRAPAVAGRSEGMWSGIMAREREPAGGVAT